MNFKLMLRLSLGIMWIGTQIGTAIAAETIANTKIQFASPDQDQDAGEPGGRGRGGAGRGPCKAYESLTALVPVVKLNTKNKVWGLTSSDRPTFWFYIPVQLIPEKPIEFTLKDQNENMIYKTKLKVQSSQDGIIQITIPETVKPLEIDRTYRWGFSVQCDEKDTTANTFVQGSIRRIAIPAEITDSLKTQLPIDRAMMFAKHGIWFDALTILGQEFCPNKTPDSAIVESWRTLLEQGNLADLSKKPIVPCCTVK